MSPLTEPFPIRSCGGDMTHLRAALSGLLHVYTWREPDTRRKYSKLSELLSAPDSSNVPLFSRYFLVSVRAIVRCPPALSGPPFLSGQGGQPFWGKRV